MSKENIVLCFCKHPVSGRVKSRLAKDIGNDYAVEIYKVLLDECLKNISKLKYEVVLYCHPDTNHPVLRMYKDTYGLVLKNQSDGDLGMKMFHAINDNLVAKKNVVLIGSDCLELNASYINNAFEHLNSGFEIVLGPATDGGYALLGASKIDVSIFQNIAWSTNQVLHQTEEKIRSLNWNYKHLNKVRDLDTLADFQYFATHKEYQSFFLRLNSLMH
jgi:rSAM/selenodomain-associated transferase 1